MEEKEKKEVAKRFLNFCERYMNLFVKNYELIQLAEISDVNFIVAFFKTEKATYKFIYGFYYYFLVLEKRNFIVTNELINGRELFRFYNFKRRTIHSNYISNTKMWDKIQLKYFE